MWVFVIQNIHVTAYSPLGTPPSSAMFKDYQPDLLMNDPVVKEMAKKYNKNVGQVCCCYRLWDPGTVGSAFG